MLINRYALDHEGYVKDCTLIPPTSQKPAQVERDLRYFIQSHIDKPVEFLKKESEKIVRSYDLASHALYTSWCSRGTKRERHHRGSAVTLLELKDITYVVKGKTILSGLSCSIASGEVHALLGTNGTGKSTLAYLVMGCEDTGLHPDPGV